MLTSITNVGDVSVSDDSHQIDNIYTEDAEVNFDLGQHEDEDDNMNVQYEQNKFTYGDMMIKLGELARTVQNDQYK